VDLLELPHTQLAAHHMGIVLLLLLLPIQQEICQLL
jgi:hypothetical protein